MVTSSRKFSVLRLTPISISSGSAAVFADGKIPGDRETAVLGQADALAAGSLLDLVINLHGKRNGNALSICGHIEVF